MMGGRRVLVCVKVSVVVERGAMVIDWEDEREDGSE